MNTKLKKILIIIIIILIIALIGLLVYNFVIKKSTTQENGGAGLPEGQENEENGAAGEEEISQPRPEVRIKAISQEPIFSPTITSDKTKVVYYLRSNGNVWQSNFDGSNLSQTSTTILENLVKVIWSPDKNNVITIFQDNLENISKYFYSYATQKALPLDKYINYIAWSPDSKKIAYQYQNDFTDNNNISTANPDGTKYMTLLKTRMKNLIIEWPKGSDIFLREKPSGIAQSSLYSLNTLSKSFNNIMPNVYGLSIKWSYEGDKILYSKTNSKGGNIGIFIADRNGINEKSANVSTLAEKCAWSQDTRYIYCAVPKNIADAKVLPDDFYKGTFIGNDEFYKINIGTGEKTNILEKENLIEAYDAADLLLSPQENYLFFINKENGLLYSIKL
ncbi:hypothetical protein KKF60_03305 [Patescibacteria group bacterium]|nr:hypothetical protein [Patescibacteria group bacterium]MBU4458895.1 hypothetical protein [Patescibacteria group bacterium]MCG2696177.1 hypothetical protein [Candidatus Portnoybacteria bacterium]